ncbi:MAG: hypothetical protein NT080_13515 [Spirochaetes bacterium]|nr:hypothetical protein [Spirochaetota bacterium]
MTNDFYAEFLQNYSSRQVRVTPFASHAMGISMPDTVLKIESYMIVCVPFRMSMNQVTLLASLSPDELSFFSRFKGSLAGLTLVFKPENRQQPLKTFSRCVMSGVSPVPGRENFGTLTLDFKPCPPDIVTMLGGYFDYLDGLKRSFDEAAMKSLRIDSTISHRLGFNNFSELITGNSMIKLAVYSMSFNELEFLAPPASPDLPAGTTAELKMFFQRYRFSVEASVSASSRTAAGVLKGTVKLGFSPELVEILRDFRPLPARAG